MMPSMKLAVFRLLVLSNLDEVYRRFRVMTEPASISEMVVWLVVQMKWPSKDTVSKHKILCVPLVLKIKMTTIKQNYMILMPIIKVSSPWNRDSLCQCHLTQNGKSDF
jgi:hypothetical protein